MRKKIVAGNWKMHKNAAQTEELLSELISKIPAQTTAQVIVAPTFVNLQAAVAKVKTQLSLLLLKTFTKLKVELLQERFLLIC